MIEQFINPYYQNIDTISGDNIPSPFEYMWKNYFDVVDKCMMSAFNKLYGAEVFGFDSVKYLQGLNVIKMTFFQYLFMKEEIEIDTINNRVKSMDFYMDKYNLSCNNLLKQLVCLSCKDYKITEVMIDDSGYEFSDDFNNDFNS